MINWFILRFSPSIAIRIVSWLKYRDTYRIVRVPYRYAPTFTAAVWAVAWVAILLNFVKSSLCLIHVLPCHETLTMLQTTSWQCNWQIVISNYVFSKSLWGLMWHNVMLDVPENLKILSLGRNNIKSLTGLVSKWLVKMISNFNIQALILAYSASSCAY